jgi:hypothetical protein
MPLRGSTPRGALGDEMLDFEQLALSFLFFTVAALLALWVFNA